MKIKTLTISAVLSSLALVIFVLESYIPPVVPLPGVKLGLANIVILYAMVTLGTYPALFVLIIKIFLGNLFAGSALSLVYSLSGGALCFVAEMIMLKKVPKNQMWVVSVIGAIFHNIGQIIAAAVILDTEKIVLYLTVLIPIGIITGAFTGLCVTFMLKATEKINYLR